MNSMNNSYRLAVQIIMLLGLAALSFASCGKNEPSLSGGIITEITMTTAVDQNNRPLNPTSVFPTDADAFICSFKLSGFPIGSKVKAEWIYIGGDPDIEAQIGKNQVIEVQTGTITEEGSGYTATAYPRPPLPDYTWPRGDYKVVIYVDDQEKASVSFRVE
ncbi:MAG TPA: hypothetical protein EYP71_03800 [Dehalococcoidia bacterium]|nr:hypothetical protein [Dehalococcoidia bacterium]